MSFSPIDSLKRGASQGMKSTASHERNDSITVRGDNNDNPQYYEFPEEPLKLSTDPGPYCIPEELVTHRPTLDEQFLCFFKGTPKEIRIRQIFCHTPISDREQMWLKKIREYCKLKNFILRPCLDPFLLRICYFTWRKNGEKDFIEKAYQLILETVNFRATNLPLSDTDPELKEDIAKGILYWLKRLPVSLPPERFKRLILFVFEWGIRYLCTSPCCENLWRLMQHPRDTCIVLLDARGVALHRFPIGVLTDIIRMLTRQYPFRLHRMFVINDSVLIQTVWNVVRQFLSEAQQQKICIFKTGFQEELRMSFSPLHLEEKFGGKRKEITTFYPFPLLPGPFTTGAVTLNYESAPNCWKLVSQETSRGVVWENQIRTPICWNAEELNAYIKVQLQHKESRAESKISRQYVSSSHITKDNRMSSLRATEGSFATDGGETYSAECTLAYHIQNEEKPAGGTSNITSIHCPPQYQSLHGMDSLILKDDRTCQQLSQTDTINESISSTPREDKISIVKVRSIEKFRDRCPSFSCLHCFSKRHVR